MVMSGRQVLELNNYTLKYQVDTTHLRIIIENGIS